MDDYRISHDPRLIDAAIVHRFLAASYWAAERSRETVEKTIRESLCFGAYLQGTGEQVAFARAVTDRATFAWICDVFVDPAHRGRGLSKKLMDAIVAHPDLAGCSMCLRTSDAYDLYAPYGFGPAEFHRRPGGLPAGTKPASDPASLAPAAVVQRQFEAFNAGDVTRLLATYAPDAEFVAYPGKILSRGHEEIGKRFIERFRQPNLRATLRNRIVSGATVVDHELVRWTEPDGPRERELLMIFTIRDGLIARAESIVTSGL